MSEAKGRIKNMYRMIVLACMCVFLAFSITGCDGKAEENAAVEQSGSENSNLEKHQLMEIIDASTEESVGVITDNNKIYEIIEHEMIEQWEYLEKLPDDSQKLWTFKSYEVVTELTYLKDKKPWVTVSQMDLYMAENSCFIVEQSLDRDSDTEVVIAKIPDSAKEYLLELTQNNGNISSAKDELIKQWGIGSPNEKVPLDAASIEVDSSMESSEDEENLYPYSDIGEFDYEGVEKASKKQKVEIIDVADAKILATLTDLNKIVDFLNGQQMAKWKRIQQLPSDAKPLCDLVRYAPERKTTNQNLVEQSRLCLYQNSDGYYIKDITALPNDISVQDPSIKIFEIPKEAGDYLISLKTY